MRQTKTEDPNNEWAEVHIVDFERYLTEQCQPYFEDVLTQEFSKYMAPMWWSVGYVIQRSIADNVPVNPDDIETLIDRSMLLLMLLTYSENPIFPEILYKFVDPMAQELKIVSDNDAINDEIYKRIGFIVLRLQDGETLTVPDLTESNEITLGITDRNHN